MGHQISIGTLKVAIYTGALPSTTFIERMVSGLGKSGLQVLLFGKIKKDIPKRQNVQVAGYRDNLFQKWNLLLFFWKFSVLLKFNKPHQKKQLDNLIKKEGNYSIWKRALSYSILWHQPDVLHIQWAKDIPNFLWVKEFGIKLVLSLRGAHINYSPITVPGLADQYQKAFPQVDAFHGVSQAICLEAQKNGADPLRCKVVYSGLNLDDFPFNSNKYTRGFPETTKIISVGRSHWKKGYTLALDALSDIKNEYCFSFHYTIIGASDNEEHIFQRHQLGLLNEVSLLGNLPFDKVKKAIQEADMLLLPSLEEGIANVVLEAMALGKLVVSSDCGGMAEVVKDGETGFLFKNRSKVGLIEALNRAVQLHADEKQRMVKMARKKIEEQHSEELMVQGMQDLYSQVIND